eukprot:g30235.t1
MVLRADADPQPTNALTFLEAPVAFPTPKHHKEWSELRVRNKNDPAGTGLTTSNVRLIYWSNFVNINKKMMTCHWMSGAGSARAAFTWGQTQRRADVDGRQVQVLVH